MDFSTIFFNVLASIYLVLQRLVFLIFYPYKTMRRISSETDWTQIGVICSFILIYFYVASQFRQSEYEFFFLFLLTIINYLLTVYFFYYLSGLFKKDLSIQSFTFTLGYALLPTLIWFISNSFLYVLLPPPRTTSMMGKSFSIMYIAFCISLLLWKIILLYLAVRFSSRLSIYKIIYFILLYLCIMAPYALFLYTMGLFRIPFI